MSPPDHSTLRAGSGKRDITTDAPAVSIRDRLYARALTLDDSPPADTFDQGSYEVIECLLGPGWQPLYEAAAERVLSRL